MVWKVTVIEFAPLNVTKGHELTSISPKTYSTKNGEVKVNYQPGRRPHHGCRVIRACLARVQTPGGSDEDDADVK